MRDSAPIQTAQSSGSFLVLRNVSFRPRRREVDVRSWRETLRSIGTEVSVLD